MTTKMLVPGLQQNHIKAFVSCTLILKVRFSIATITNMDSAFVVTVENILETSRIGTTHWWNDFKLSFIKNMVIYIPQILDYIRGKHLEDTMMTPAPAWYETPVFHVALYVLFPSESCKFVLKVKWHFRCSRLLNWPVELYRHDDAGMRTELQINSGDHIELQRLQAFHLSSPFNPSPLHICQTTRRTNE